VKNAEHWFQTKDNKWYTADIKRINIASQLVERSQNINRSTIIAIHMAVLLCVNINNFIIFSSMTSSITSHFKLLNNHYILYIIITTTTTSLTIIK